MIDEANRIKDRLRACETVADVHAVADEERAAVKAMSETEEGRPLAKQIANLKAYRIGELNR